MIIKKEKGKNEQKGRDFVIFNEMLAIAFRQLKWKKSNQQAGRRNNATIIFGL